MDYSFLDKRFLAVSPETWRQINQLLARYAVLHEMVDPAVIRAAASRITQQENVPRFRIATVAIARPPSRERAWRRTHSCHGFPPSASIPRSAPGRTVHAG